MPLTRRAGHMDVSNTVDVTDPEAVGTVIHEILEARYPHFEHSTLDTLLGDFARLYRGDFPGFRACDIRYHDLQHVLDVTLAMVRLMVGHDGQVEPRQQLGADHVLTGIVSALFHDSGYIRRSHDQQHPTGAVYTRIHVRRSARFMSQYLPTVGLSRLVPVCMRLVHFTGYEMNPRDIEVHSTHEYTLGCLLGTADLIAQMADVNYLEKCREHLYQEFEAGGIAGEQPGLLQGDIIYRSPQHLMEATPDFIDEAITIRLDGHFGGVYRYASDFFGGDNLYMNAIQDNYDTLKSGLAAGAAVPACASLP